MLRRGLPLFFIAATLFSSCESDSNPSARHNVHKIYYHGFDDFIYNFALVSFDKSEESHVVLGNVKEIVYTETQDSVVGALYNLEPYYLLKRFVRKFEDGRLIAEDIFSYTDKEISSSIHYSFEYDGKQLTSLEYTKDLVTNTYQVIWDEMGQNITTLVSDQQVELHYTHDENVNPFKDKFTADYFQVEGIDHYVDLAAFNKNNIVTFARSSGLPYLYQVDYGYDRGAPVKLDAYYINESNAKQRILTCSFEY